MLKRHNLYNMQLSFDNNSKEHLECICAVLLQIIYITVFGTWVFWTTPSSESKVYNYHDTRKQALFLKRFPHEGPGYISPTVLLTHMRTCERQMPHTQPSRIKGNLLV